jgi:hypothetical protein
MAAELSQGGPVCIFHALLALHSLILFDVGSPLRLDRLRKRNCDSFGSCLGEPRILASKVNHGPLF